ncbi:MAG: hypothetical protein LKF42_04420 [Streptococcaceae bacterium]|jgi:integral membrane protein (TIGR03766 family)|nr:hypothetical protein [Streptococcaceae bacterium]MCH4177493.1 hypothetical protein [Streptococcaceae bacterium]
MQLKNRLHHLSNQFIFRLFYLLFGITYISVITSDNFILGDNQQKGTSTTIELVLFLAALLLIAGLFFLFPKLKKIFNFILIQHKVLTSIFLFLILIIFQISFVTILHPEIGWDVSALIDTLRNVDDLNNQAYFSLNYNNLPILLFMNTLSSIFKMHSWLFFDYITIFWVDLSIVFSVATCWLIDKRYFANSLYLHILFFGIFPWIIIPYTDTWVLPFVSAFLFFYFATKKVVYLWQKLILLICFSFFVCAAFLIKPSAIIPVIAIIIIEILSLLKKDYFSVSKCLTGLSLILTILFSFFIMYNSFQSKIENQTLIQVNRERAIPAIHFMNMGVYGDGGYHAEDALKMGELATRAEKVEYSRKTLFKRLKKMGVFGYFKFLIRKQVNNTADGSFAWGKEGNFIKGNQLPQSSGIKGTLENYLYIYGEKIANFRFIAQFIWLFILSIIFWGWQNRSQNMQMIRLSIIGAFIFLLLFEGGRSRYIIQFLPLFLIGATLSINDTKINLKRFINLLSFKKIN